MKPTIMIKRTKNWHMVHKHKISPLKWGCVSHRKMCRVSSSKMTKFHYLQAYFLYKGYKYLLYSFEVFRLTFWLYKLNSSNVVKGNFFCKDKLSAYQGGIVPKQSTLQPCKNIRTSLLFLGWRTSRIQFFGICFTIFKCLQGHQN